jgi:hypothetical protein
LTLRLPESFSGKPAKVFRPLAEQTVPSERKGDELAFTVPSFVLFDAVVVSE